MSEPDGPDATRRTLVRGVVVLGAVGVGAGLSRVGEGTYKLASASSASDVATQAPAPVETAAPEATPSAEPTKAAKAKPKASAKPTKSADAAEDKPSKADQTQQAAKAKTDKADKKDKPKAKQEPKPAGTPLGPSSKVPVGGGAIFKDKRVVVTQPKKGEYKAYDALCTHAACLVDQVENNVIHCPCHSAKFSAADGSVIKPSVARRPLNPKTVTESGGTIYLT